MLTDVDGRAYSRKVLMAIVLAGAFVALLAETFLNNGLTTIMKSLQVSQSTAQWLSTAYQLVMGLMIPLSAWIFNNFRSRNSYKGMLAIFTVGSFVCFIAPNFAMLGIELVIPLYLQNVRGLSALTTGLILIPGAVLTGISNPVAGVIFDKIGTRKVSLLGFTLLTLGTLPMLTFDTTTGIVWIMLLYALQLIGITFITMNDFTAGINALDPELKAHGNAASSTIRQIGSSLGTALSITMVTLGMNFSRGVSKMGSMVVGYHWAFMMMTIVAVFGLVLSFWLPKQAR